MKKRSFSLPVVVLFFAVGFFLGLFFKLSFKNEQSIELTAQRNYNRELSKRAYHASDSVSDKIFPLLDSLTSKGKVSEDPIKELLWESYQCLEFDKNVLRHYEQFYVADSAFRKTYFF